MNSLFARPLRTHVAHVICLYIKLNKYKKEVPVKMTTTNFRITFVALFLKSFELNLTTIPRGKD